MAATADAGGSTATADAGGSVAPSQRMGEGLHSKAALDAIPLLQFAHESLGQVCRLRVKAHKVRRRQVRLPQKAHAGFARPFGGLRE